MKPDTPPRCPDCDVTMEEMRYHTGGHKPHFVSDEDREGILGKIGVKQTYNATAVVCPECGLSRIYADIEES